ncbi:uncharacterized protein METZ01_LOCUS78996 [marine metagenome]|uniref:DUF1385 domain-containing protein n=1 Tax=marine metagenome TaxID=408172 RepID=A0A381UD40_9ZZZZ
MKRFLILSAMKPSILVGGQAVIEGVMMRVPGAYATAVRDSKGKIHINRELFISITEYSKFWNKPVFRGMASLFEAMKLGMSTLQWSADIAMPPKEDEKEPNRVLDFVTTLFSICLAIFLFMIAPMWITTTFLNVEKEVIWFNLISGGFRIVFFIIYLVLISLLKDIRRLFQYHGAEHRVIYNFESGMDITIDNAQSFPTQHPRCGTSFLFIVLLSAILIFAVVDTIIMSVLGTISLSIRLLFHLPMIPIVSGVGYEIIKLIAKKNSLLFRLLRKPGLWLQNITTRPPDNNMVYVSITALKNAFGDKYEQMVGEEYTAEAIG